MTLFFQFQGGPYYHDKPLMIVSNKVLEAQTEIYFPAANHNNLIMQWEDNWQLRSIVLGMSLNLLVS